MVTDNQVRTLHKSMNKKSTISAAADKAGMDRKTARKYIQLGKMPSEVAASHSWRTRKDPFEQVWAEIQQKLEINPGLQSKTLFEDLQRRYPGRFQNGQLRTLQRRIKQWRALEGPPKEVYFPQQHHPGQLCGSDFTSMNSLGITIGGQPFPHLVYHFVLSYSNWQTGTVCFTESFESLSEGLQNALCTLGGVPATHRTDQLSAAVHKDLNRAVFTQRYQGLLRHYGLAGSTTAPDSPHQNGDTEQSHYRFKQALDQSLMLRGSRDFSDREAYCLYLDKLFGQLNAGCRDRLSEELATLKKLPGARLTSYKDLKVRVGPSSTIRVQKNVYSVDSRLVGEVVQVRLRAEHIEIWYSRKRVDVLPRQRGEGGHKIEYRHVIDWLVRKPGAFENYRYRQDLFPTHRFRMAYDQLKSRLNGRTSKAYLQILELAAKQNQDLVDQALGYLIDADAPISLQAVQELMQQKSKLLKPAEVEIAPVELAAYDRLLEFGRAAV